MPALAPRNSLLRAIRHQQPQRVPDVDTFDWRSTHGLSDSRIHLIEHFDDAGRGTQGQMAADSAYVAALSQGVQYGDAIIATMNGGIATYGWQSYDLRRS